ncbi:MAG: TolC family protein [Lentisphaerae bacterium]|jgi:outer membrane protein, heavy metal efflux system|nr:TolC family protein [Lentisphaerota bacterium]MBT4817766.1 TolC family protein [Lentisphaerota bacterium]MBT5610869.1 TolC family protein [Lentisphaerota bacterium]MBT7053699.1 TolC family protein [Lentisphaerota bacterium]MBT7841160.1 TolC family protein [Lentisphaerota bacterium]
MRKTATALARGLLGAFALTVTTSASESQDVPPSPSPPQAIDEAGTGLANLIRLGAERNATVNAARAEWRAAIEELPQAAALPDPMVRFDYFGESVETRVGPQEYRYGISQSFPFPGTRRQAEQVAAEEVRIKHAEYDLALRNLIVDISVSYSELLYVRGAADITHQHQDVLNHIVKATNAGLADGKASLNDVLRAQSQLAQLSYDLVLLRELEHVETAKINALLDRPVGTTVTTTPPHPVRHVRLSLEHIQARAIAARQEIEIAGAVSGKRREAVRLAKLRNKPSFTVNAMRIETGESALGGSESGKNPWLLGAAISLPLWPGRNRSRVRQAQLLHEAAEHRKRAIENRTDSDVRSAYFRLENARRLIELYDKSLIPQAEQAMGTVEQWHDGETRNVSGFLETQSVWLNFRLARLRAATDYQQYLSRLERLVGGALTPTGEEAAQ